MNPKVSIILPVYNAALYLREAIESLLNQTFSDFELLIYNDGSVDESDKVISTFSDPRIKYLAFEKNKGLIHVLNTGLKQASGQYIVRMDADDVCEKDRIYKQVEFMDNHREVGACGTQLKILGTQQIVARPCQDNELRWWIFKSSPLAHPSVIIRRSVLTDHQLVFNAEAYVAEDFDLWWRMAFFTKLANLPEALLHYRLHPGQESSAKTDAQTNNHRKSLVEFMHILGLDTSVYSPEFVVKMLNRDLELYPQNLYKSFNFFKVLESSDSAVNFFTENDIQTKKFEVIGYQMENLVCFDSLSLKLSFDKSFRELMNLRNLSHSVWVIKSLFRWKTR